MSTPRKDPDASLALARAAADLADDGKAIDITILDLREHSSVADYFVIASGRSHIQVEAICSRIVDGVRERLEAKPIAVEGLGNALWAVLDYGSVVVHVFQEQIREVYDLERLWSLAPRWKHGDEPAAAARKRTPAGEAPKRARPAAKATATPKPAKRAKTAKAAEAAKVAKGTKGAQGTKATKAARSTKVAKATQDAPSAKATKTAPAKKTATAKPAKTPKATKPGEAPTASPRPARAKAASRTPRG